MIEKLKEHKILAGIVLVGVIGLLWFMLGGGAPATDTGLLGTSSVAASASGNATVAGVDRELQDTLDKVRAIQLADPVLGDPVFMSLQDIGQQIVPEPFGRPNPFAPISAGK